MKSEKVTLKSKDSAVNNQPALTVEKGLDYFDIAKRAIISATFIALERMGVVTEEEVRSHEFQQEFVKEYDKFVPGCLDNWLDFFTLKGVK